MHIVLVHVHVKPGSVEPFLTATLDNASKSNLEPGVLRFDFFQQTEDPTRFTLIEIYQSPDEQKKHRETAHYLRWRETAADMMAEERTIVPYRNILPSDENWK